MASKFTARGRNVAVIAFGTLASVVSIVLTSY